MNPPCPLTQNLLAHSCISPPHTTLPDLVFLDSLPQGASLGPCSHLHVGWGCCRLLLTLYHVNMREALPCLCVELSLVHVHAHARSLRHCVTHCLSICPPACVVLEVWPSWAKLRAPLCHSWCTAKLILLCKPSCGPAMPTPGLLAGLQPRLAASGRRAVMPLRGRKAKARCVRTPFLQDSAGE